ncbi:MAG: hypothetical protein LBU35_00920 [Holosporales bacterium]|nr:hypothetical protein [Holosporales bacterium]
MLFNNYKFLEDSGRIYLTKEEISVFEIILNDKKQGKRRERINLDNSDYDKAALLKASPRLYKAPNQAVAPDWGWEATRQLRWPPTRPEPPPIFIKISTAKR